MRRRRIYRVLGFLLTWLLMGARPEQKPPEAEISNGLIKAHLFLPDSEIGYYRAVRFDRSGIISALNFKGHSFFGQWFGNYNPTKDDAIMGPVEAFDPIGFDGAKTNETFVKIGVGELIRPDDKAYEFSRTYAIANEGKWKIKHKADRVEFTHELKGREYAYSYFKSVKLSKNKSVMVLSHSLKNTGRKAIETTVFNHNFLVIDQQPTGPGFEVTFPSAITEKLVRSADYASIQDNKLIFQKELQNRSVALKDATSGVASVYDIKVENRNTGAGVRITGNRSISQMVFWSSRKTVCPEPYITIKVEPGKKFEWDIAYEFYVNDSISRVWEKLRQ